MSVVRGIVRVMDERIEALESEVAALRRLVSSAGRSGFVGSGSVASDSVGSDSVGSGSAVLGSAGADHGAACGSGTALTELPDDALVEAADALGRTVRSAESLLAAVAGEVARRSPVEAGREGLAKRQGFRSPARLVAAATGGAVASAARIVRVGAATAPRLALTGEVLPAAHPHVAAALRSGSVSVESASAITGMLDRVAPRADAAASDAVEAVLAERAADLPHDLMLKVIAQAEARLDQDGLAPQEDELYDRRSLRITEDRTGAVKLTACLDPETGAMVKAAIASLVTNMIRTERAGGVADPGGSVPGGVASGGVVSGGADRADATTDAAAVAGANAGTVPGTGGISDGDRAGSVLGERRTIAQLQADALGMVARHVLGCSRMPQAPAATVVVRCDVETLTAGTGQAEIDGVARPVSAGAARRIAASAELIPAVFDGGSLPLDLGRDARLFTRAQRLALYERDAGCACCGLDAAYTEAHHIRWWQRDTGPTDLDNGVLLCPPCHARMHHDGWHIDVRDDRVWFTPPAHIDPRREPRLGGAARYRLPRHLAA